MIEAANQATRELAGLPAKRLTIASFMPLSPTLGVPASVAKGNSRRGVCGGVERLPGPGVRLVPPDGDGIDGIGVIDAR